MQSTADYHALIQTVHGTSFPFVGLARVSQLSMIGSSLQSNQQATGSGKPDGTPPSASGQPSES